MSGTEADNQNGTGTHSTALVDAVKNSNEIEVKRLIDVGVDVNETDDQGKSALFYAVQNKNHDMVRVLVERGANINSTADSYGRTLLVCAITKSKEIASYLFEKGARFHNLHIPLILPIFIENHFKSESLTSPIISEVLPMLKENGVKLKKIAKSLANMVLCKIPFLTTDVIKSHKSDHLFHILGKKKSLLSVLTEASEYIAKENYEKKESIAKLLTLVKGENTISAILKLLEEFSVKPESTDADGNTGVHYATCLPFMGVPEKTVTDIFKELRDFGVPLNAKNYQGQTPLLYCLSGSVEYLKEEDKLCAIKTLVTVCTDLVNSGSNDDVKSPSGETIFHLIIKLFQQGLYISNETKRENFLKEVVNLLEMVERYKEAGRYDSFNNSPLHLWASLKLSSGQEYKSSFTKESKFEKHLKIILDHLLVCKAQKNARNDSDETPLHLCRTWSAVKLLIDVGANPNDVDSSKRPPLLAAAINKTFLVNPPHFFPDFQEDEKIFFINAVKKELDLWKFDENDRSILGVLIESEAYDLSKALVDFACNLDKEEKEVQKILLSLLNAICKDKSLHIMWKNNLVERLLSHTKQKRIDVVGKPFNICCESLIAHVQEKKEKLDNDELPNKKQRKEEPLSEEEARTEKKEKTEIQESVLCHIAKTFRSYGAELSSESYKTLEANCSEIADIIREKAVQLLIPWTSVSSTYKTVLDKVARRQEYEEIESVCYHKEQIGRGSFGDIFVGINKNDSREVSIQRTTKTPLQQLENKQDRINRYAHLHVDCEHVVRYFFSLEDKNFLYTVFELMEGNLDVYLSGNTFDKSKSTLLCEDMVKGLKYLHGQKYFNHDLKPENILFKTCPKLCLKIADFSLRTSAVTGTTEDDSSCWIAPEILNPCTDKTEASAMFSCGLLLHYILSKQKHPFSLNNNQAPHEIEANIKNGRMEGWDDSLSPEATHLLKNMLKKNRPTASQALLHPLFWSQEKKIDLLNAVGNQPVFEYQREGKSTCLTPAETDLENNFSTIVRHGKWNDALYKDMPAIFAEMTKVRKSYDTTSAVELVRFIRNAYSHVSEDKRPTLIRKLLLEDFVFLDYFPHLVMEVYKAVTTHGWDQTIDEIKYAMNK